jgi:Holliday junction DNA helicase RuvA
MISFLEGTIEYHGDRFVIINAGAIGYKVTLGTKLLNSLAKSQEKVNLVSSSSEAEAQQKIRLFIHSQLNMREGTFDMYGFDKQGDLDLFHTLTSVSGIGPKAAMNIMSTVEPQHLKAAVMNEDSDFLKKVSGLGPKTAQRLIVELQDKLDYIDVGDMAGRNLGEETHALEALLSLGYNQSEAKEALKAVAKTSVTLQDRVREALKLLGRK